MVNLRRHEFIEQEDTDANHAKFSGICDFVNDVRREDFNTSTYSADYWRGIELARNAHNFMCDTHRSINQKRKTGENYEIHPLAVQKLFIGNVHNSDGAIASLLHDVLEDVGSEDVRFGYQRILEEFGLNVAALVVELTNVYTKENFPKLNRMERKRAECRRLGEISSVGQSIKLCDVYDNLSSINSLFKEDSGFAILFIKEKAELLPSLWLGEKSLYGKVKERLRFLMEKYEIVLEKPKFDDVEEDEELVVI